MEQGAVILLRLVFGLVGFILIVLAYLIGTSRYEHKPAE